MANKKLIERYKVMYQQINNITPEVYAGIALALHRTYGWGYERINKVFSESQNIWQGAVKEGYDVIQKCYEETGIELKRRV